MVGYPESLTDPSYRCQILTLTYPLIGNYGVPDGVKDSYGLTMELESDKIWASALVVGSYVEEFSHWNAKKSLSQWLEEQGVPGISGEFFFPLNMPFLGTLCTSYIKYPTLLDVLFSDSHHSPVTALTCIYWLTHSESELSGFTCTSSLTMNKKFQYRMRLKNFEFIVSERVQVNPDN